MKRSRWIKIQPLAGRSMIPVYPFVLSPAEQVRFVDSGLGQI